MGHRKNRKRDRRTAAVYETAEPRWTRSRAPAAAADDDEPEMAFSDPREVPVLVARSMLGRGAATATRCGACREFVEDGDAGRGTCLHPGSGILSPWTDTPGCDFFAAARRH
jgi:hypothetical protein